MFKLSDLVWSTSKEDLSTYPGATNDGSETLVTVSLTVTACGITAAEVHATEDGKLVHDSHGALNLQQTLVQNIHFNLYGEVVQDLRETIKFVKDQTANLNSFKDGLERADVENVQALRAIDMAISSVLTPIANGLEATISKINKTHD